MSRRNSILIVFFIICLCATLAAQKISRGSVHGFIVDADNDEPLPYTNVFLANTTLGDAADDRGEFIIEKIPPGSYKLVVSRIGYDIYVRDVVVLPEKTTNMDVRLKVQSIEGEEIRVVGERDTRQWRRDLREFKSYFIGETPNANKCDIINPEVLSFTREAGTNNLLASSDSVLVVENRALGYRIDIILQSFHWGFGGGYFLIYPRFTALSPKNERQQRKWDKERERTFHNSMRSFFASLADGKYSRDYDLAKVITGSSLGSRNGALLDSLAISEADSARGLKRLDFTGVMQVRRKTGGTSTLHLNYDYIDFDDYGNIYPGDGVKISGYWGQQRVADLLPFDYWPN